MAGRGPRPCVRSLSPPDARPTLTALSLLPPLNTQKRCIRVRDGEVRPSVEVAFNSSRRVKEPFTLGPVALVSIEPTPGRSRHVRSADRSEKGRASSAQLHPAFLLTPILLHNADRHCAVVICFSIRFIDTALRARPESRVERYQVVADTLAAFLFGVICAPVEAVDQDAVALPLSLIGAISLDAMPFGLDVQTRPLVFEADRIKPIIRHAFRRILQEFVMGHSLDKHHPGPLKVVSVFGDDDQTALHVILVRQRGLT